MLNRSKYVLTLMALPFILTFNHSLYATINVLTTTPDLAAITKEVGGDLVTVESLCKGTQDPHFLEAKPSYMMKANQSDLLISVGLGLEIGWFPSIVKGARNPKVQAGQPGYLEVGPAVERLEIPTGKVSRAQGDIHPEGNPHITLDPIRAGEIAVVIGKRLADLDIKNELQYTKNALVLKKNLEDKTKDWQERIKASGVTKVITYHRTYNYFLDRFGIISATYLEPVPGVPPTAKHIMGVIELIKSQNIKLVMVENFFDPAVTKRIVADVPALQAMSTPVSVGGEDSIKKIDDLFEHLVRVIEGKLK